MGLYAQQQSLWIYFVNYYYFKGFLFMSFYISSDKMLLEITILCISF